MGQVYQSFTIRYGISCSFSLFDSLHQIEVVPFHSYFAERFLLLIGVEYCQMVFFGPYYDHIIFQCVIFIVHVDLAVLLE